MCGFNFNINQTKNEATWNFKVPIHILLSAKILVAGGDFPLEIIDLINPKLKPDIVENEIGDIFGATGGILQNKIVLCGGNDNAAT